MASFSFGVPSAESGVLAYRFLLLGRLLVLRGRLVVHGLGGLHLHEGPALLAAEPAAGWPKAASEDHLGHRRLGVHGLATQRLQKPPRHREVNAAFQSSS
jgi:hypothetical protein